MKACRYVTCRVLGLALVLLSHTAEAQLAAVVSPPVLHPVVMPVLSRSAQSWRSGVGGWGESLAEQALKLQGFTEVVEVKTPGGQGIDRLGLKYDMTGKLVDARIVEVKTHRGTTPHLGKTQLGRQMSRSWLADKLKSMRNSGDAKLRKLAREISILRKQSGMPIESLGEIHEVNTRTGRYILRNPLTGEILSTDSVPRVLKRIQRNVAGAGKAWTEDSLAQWRNIRRTNMSGWLRQGSAAANMGAMRGHGLAAISETITRKGAARSLRRLTRIAGPLGSAVALATDIHDIYSHISAYHRGALSRRQMVIAISSSVGGIAGAGVGAATGAWIGTLGGPLVWITVPAGATIGGIVGYLGGSIAGSSLAGAWYARLDEGVKTQVDTWIMTHAPAEVVR